MRATLGAMVVAGAALAVMMWWLRGAEQRRSPQSGQVPPAPSSATSTRAALPDRRAVAGNAAPAAPPPEVAMLALRGRVVDAEQRPIAGARVACSDGRDLGVDQPALTQATGEFALACRHPGGARVVASKAGYGPRGGWVETGGAPIVIALAAGVTVRGEVCNAKGQPIAGAQVALALDAPLHADLVFPFDSPGRATTAGDGSFELRDLPAGRIELRATERAHDIATISLEVAPGSEGHACFTLRHVGLVEGIVVDAGNGAPIPGATINDEVATDSSGRFAIKRLIRGEVGFAKGMALLAVACPGYSRKIAWAAREDDGVELRIALARAAHARVRVLDRDRHPLAAANVCFTPDRVTLPADERDDACGVQGATDGNGELEQEIAPGVYADIEVWHDQHGTKHFAGLTIAPEQRLDLEFVLAIGAELRGRVLDPDGHPVAGAVARTWQAYRSDSIEGLMARGSAASDALGAFFIRGLEGRSVWVTAQASGFAATACEVTLDEQRPASVELVLERAFVLEGEVVDRDGAPVVNAWVVAQPRLAPPRDRLFGFFDAPTDARGRFTIRDLPAVLLELRVTPPGGWPGGQELLPALSLSPPFAAQRIVLPVANR